MQKKRNTNTSMLGCFQWDETDSKLQQKIKRIPPTYPPCSGLTGFAVESCCIASWLPQQIYSGASTHTSRPQATRARPACLAWRRLYCEALTTRRITNSMQRMKLQATKKWEGREVV